MVVLFNGSLLIELGCEGTSYKKRLETIDLQ